MYENSIYAVQEVKVTPAGIFAMLLSWNIRE